MRLIAGANAATEARIAGRLITDGARYSTPGFLEIIASGATRLVTTPATPVIREHVSRGAGGAAPVPASVPKPLRRTECRMLVDLSTDDARWQVALPVLQELRPHLTDELLAQVLREGEPQGLRFTALFDGDRCLAIAGWRVLANTSAIRMLYVDDLSTARGERSRGHGATLLRALVERARELGCHRVDLDSGVQRHAAHRFYLREGMDIVGHHFRRQLD